MRRLVTGLTVRHDNTSFIRGMVQKRPELDVPGGLPDRLRAEYPPVEHPLVRTHPISGGRRRQLNRATSVSSIRLPAGSLQNAVLTVTPKSSRMRTSELNATPAAFSASIVLSNSSVGT